MTLILTESFDGHSSGSNNIIGEYLDAKHGKYVSGLSGRQGGADGSPASFATTGRHGVGYVLRSYSSFGYYGILSSILDPADEDDVIIVGVAHTGTVGRTADGILFREFRNVGGTGTSFTHASVGPNAANSSTWSVYGAAGTSLATFTLILGAWKYMEIKVKVHDTAGYIIVRVDGFELANVQNVDTRNNGSGTTGLINLVQFVNTSGSSDVSWVIDDLYICNEQGSVNNDFLGDCTVTYIQPSAAGTTTGLTPSTGSNWDCVSDPVSTVAPQTSDYVSGSTNDTKDTYAMADISLTGTPIIAGIVHYAYAEKADSGTRSIGLITRLSGVEVQTSDQVISYTGAQGPRYVRQVMETKPGGGSWTQTDVNNMEIGSIVRP